MVSFRFKSTNSGKGTLQHHKEAEEIDQTTVSSKGPIPTTMGPSAQTSVTRSQNVSTTQTTKNGDGGSSELLVKNGSQEPPKITTLRDATQRSISLYRAELGADTDKFLQRFQSVEDFFDFVAGIRLREMPHEKSRWDRVMKWAEFFAGQVFAYSQEVGNFASHSNVAASIIWASCRSLLALGPKYIAMLEKVFGLFYDSSLTLVFFLRHHEFLHSTTELQYIVTACFVDLLKLVTNVSIYYGHKHSNVLFSTRGFDELFGRQIESFFAHGDHFTDTIWATRLESSSRPGGISVDLVREFLTPHDTLTRLLSLTRNNRRPRADFTCEWFERYLTQFQRSGKELLLVTGKASSGKSVLSDWVVERVQATTGRRASEVMTYSVDPDLRTELSALHVVKGLLLQMLQLNVGDNGLYKSLAAAYQLANTGKSISDIENALWASFENGLSSDRNQTIILDGVNYLKGGETETLQLLQRLQAIATKHNKTKIIVFSRPLNKATPQQYSHFQLQNEHTRQDLQHFTMSLSSLTKSFDLLSQDERSKVISIIGQKAEGSFEWIERVLDLLSTETTSAAILKRVESLPKTLPEVLNSVIATTNLKDRDTKSLLAWSLASERPLSITEVERLLEIDAATCTRVPRTTRIEDDVVRSAGRLLEIREGFVRFRSFTIKEVLLERANSVKDFKNTGAFPFHIQEAHYDLTLRLLAYVKISLTRSTQPTLSFLNDSELNENFESYELLQYSARYWSFHFQSSPMHEPTISHKLTEGFRKVFPSSNLLAVLEGSIYRYQYSTQEAINYYLLTLSLRKAVLGELAEPVLQTLLNLAVTKQIMIQLDEINEYYYQSWKVATALKIISIAVTCAHRYIESTSTITIKSKTELSTHRSELLQFIISSQNETKISSVEILRYTELLVILYLGIGETEKASHYLRKVYELNVKIHGRYAPQTVRSREALVATLQKSTKTEEVLEITESNYTEAVRTLGVNDQKRVALCWSMIDMYERRKDFHRLEEVMLSFWQSLSRSTSKDASLQERRVDVALRYAEFLKQQNRKIEAENILRGVWIDIEHQHTHSDAMVTRTRKIGEQLEILGSLAVARSVFARLWAYYVKTGKQSSPEASSVQSSLKKVTREVTGSETTHGHTSLHEIFESELSSSSSEIDAKTVKTALTLVDMHYKSQRWTEVIKISTATLHRLWPGYTGKDLNLPVPKTFLTEIVEIIICLAYSYTKLRQLDNAETSYRRLFYSVKATSGSSDEVIISTSNYLTTFYESNSMLEELVVLYKDLALEFEKRQGKTSQLTISTWYKMGDIAIRINDASSAELAYSKVYANLGADICHRDAIKAALALATIYEQQRQYSSAQKVYQSLWQMFIKHGKDYDLKADFAEDLRRKHVRIMKQESKADYQTLRQLAIDYRKALVRFYGVSHESTLKATMQLGKINEEREEHYEEAISMYEEADQKSRDLPSGQISEATLTSISAAKSRLPHLYSTSNLVHSPRAIILYEAEFGKVRSKYGHSHRESLAWLSLIAVAHAKQGHAQSTAKATKYLEASVVEILKHEKNSQNLADSAAQLAHIYIKAGLKQDGEKLLTALRSQLIFGSSDLSKNLALASGTNLDRRTWIFLVSFETTLRGEHHKYSITMADLINEIFLYESFRKVVAQKAPFLTVLGYGSRLLEFMRDIKDDPSHAKADKEVLEYVTTTLGVAQVSSHSTVREFFELILVEVYKQDVDVSVLKTVTESISTYSSKGKIQDAYDLATLVNSFQQYVGGYNGLDKIELGIKIALTLGGRGMAKGGDSKLRNAMMTMSGKIMKQVLAAAKSSKLVIQDVPIDELNQVCGLLGEQQNLEDLEWILYTLWEARHTQKAWSPSVVVNLGRRLVETQFARGRKSEAIVLCEDTCYNVRRVWGPLDATALEMHVLLSSFYTSVQNYAKAMLIHEDILRETVSEKGEEIPQAEACAIAIQHLELLKRSYQRLGGWDKEQQVYVDLYQQLAHVFGGEDAWKKGLSQIQSIDKWQTKGADNLGIWTKPQSFEFISAAGSKKHINLLRQQSSGGWSLNGHFHSHGHRIHRSFSSRSIAAQ